MTLRGKPVILVVDDDPHVLHALSFFLRAEGYAVRACADAAQAIAAAADGSPRCLVIDYRLGDTDGLSLAAQLRALGSKAPLVLITSHPDLRCRIGAQRADAVIVEKPLISDALSREIRFQLTTA
jgi:FixJ family two-component response regulator